ncbi:MAG: carbon-nitrogen hydrolase family protein [Parvularculaceae bacterium]
MAKQNKFRLAAIQAAHVLMDASASTEKACALILEAGRGGADVAAFGECWLPGYPFFIEAKVDKLFWEASGEYVASAVEIGGPETDALCAAAKEAGIDVVMGLAERDPNTQGSVYCTLLFISCEGQILGRHRKLKPTHAERNIWSDGDAAGLRVYERDYGRLGGLNCWEHHMMLPGYALAAQGVQVHVAAWPGGEPAKAPEGNYCWARQHLLSRAFASQAGAYVICSAGMRLPEHVPERYKPLCDWWHTGQSVIIDPRGEIIAGPLDGEGILYADGSLDIIARQKAATDIAGHYSRPDIFDFAIKNSAPRAALRR